MLLYSYLTKFTANRKYDLKINEQLLKRTSAQNPLDKTEKNERERGEGGGGGGIHLLRPWFVRGLIHKLALS